MGARQGAAYVPPATGDAKGHLLFMRDTTLMAQPLEAKSLESAGDAFPVAEQVVLGRNYAAFTASANGVLVFLARGNSVNQIGWFDRSGTSLGPVGAPGPVYEPSVSPDEKSVLFWRRSDAGSDLWVRDLNRGTEDATHQQSVEQHHARLVFPGRPDCLFIESRRRKIRSLPKVRQRKRAG